MLRVTTSVEVITSGAKDIAEELGGGFRDDSLILIEGGSKSGKSAISQYLAHSMLCDKRNAVAYYTTESSVKNLIAQMDSLSLPVLGDFVAGRLRIYLLGSRYNPKDAKKALRLLIDNLSELPGRFNLVIVDSVTPLLIPVSRVAKLDFLFACKELCEQGRSIGLVMDSHILEKKLFSRVYALSDYYLRLKSEDMMLGSGQVDSRMIKALEVLKLRGAERREGGGIKFEIIPNIGIQILPLIRVRV